jgi:cytochrome c-type biogenesis protein
MDQSLNFILAFVAGFISFFAPCVVILIPAFLAHLAGVSLVDVAQEKEKKFHWTIFINTIFFVLGFTVIFVALGASLGFLSKFVIDFQVWLNRIGGLVIIFFGLVTMDLIKIKFLQSTHKLQIKKANKVKYLGSFIVGSAFAIGWTPCVGPILAAILLLAGSSGTINAGVGLLLAYSAGLMIPYLVTGAFTSWAAKFLSSHGKFIKYFNYIAGVLLIILGVLIFTNYFPKLIGYLYFLLPR